MPIEFENSELTELTPKIAVIGVGGAGCNAVTNMIKANLQGVDFVVANTDAQSLLSVPADTRIQLGVEITRGLGAGAQPKVGEAAAEESLDQIDKVLEGCHMAFITAGMGGGTGTGASPVVARRAREKGILTVGVVTKPFHFEGGRRMKLAEAGIKTLQDHVDTLIIIPNQNLFHVASEQTTFQEAFALADEVLHSGVRSITDLMVVPGLINLDFADVRTVMTEMGKAMMGTGDAAGENRAYLAAEAAISNQLLEDSSLRGAKGVIINVTGGPDLSLFEVDAAVNMVREMADEDALIVFGSALSEDLDGQVRVSVVATGIEGGPAPKISMPSPKAAVEVETKPAEETEVRDHEAGPENQASDVEHDGVPSTSKVTTQDTGVSVFSPPSNDHDQNDELPLDAAQSGDNQADTLEGMISGAEALEKKVLEQISGRGFVAEAPMVVKEEPEVLGQPDMLQESDYANSQDGILLEPEDEHTSADQVDDDPIPDATVGSEPEKRDQAAEALVETSSSFYQRITARYGGKLKKTATQPPTGQAETSEKPSSPSKLGGLSADDRPVPAQSPAQREIPDFLREQSN